MKSFNGQVRSLKKSFANAFKGISYCIRHERNMRIHLVAAAYVLIFSVFYDLSGAEYILLLIAIALVLFSEVVNTAIEAIVDMQDKSYDNIARIAKDAAAGAVLICSIIAAVIGCILFLKIDTIIYIFEFLAAKPQFGILFLLTLPLSALFIFGPPRGRA